MSVLLAAAAATFIALYVKLLSRQTSISNKQVYSEIIPQNTASVQTLNSPFEIIRFNLPKGIDGTHPSNLTYFEYNNDPYILVRYIFYKFDNDVSVITHPNK